MIGETVGSYKILKKIGEGGMGVVYVAEHTLLGRRAAVKMLLPQFSQDPEVLGRFFNEARAATQVKHPGLVDVFDYGKHSSGSAYLIMEFLDGISLSTKIYSAGMVGLDQLAGIARQIASAVGAAHNKGIVHRDLKPDNVFIVPDEMMPNGVRVKILDFGIAKVREESAGEAQFQTQAAAILGTPAYMSPEQCKGAGLVDHRTDIYALGCIMYQMACGQLPFMMPSPGEIMAAHLFKPALPPSVHAPSLRPELDAIILKCLAKNPDERYASMSELNQELDRLVPPARATAVGVPDGQATLFQSQARPTFVSPGSTADNATRMPQAAGADGATFVAPPPTMISAVEQATQFAPYAPGTLAPLESTGTIVQPGAPPPPAPGRPVARPVLVDAPPPAPVAPPVARAPMVSRPVGASGAMPSWRPTQSWWMHGVDGNAVVARINETGARPSRLVPYLAGNQWLFSAVLVKDDAPSWWFEIGVDTATLNARLAERSARLVDLNSYGEGSARRWAAIMVEHKSVIPWWWYDGLDADGVQRKLDEHGAMVADIDTYSDGGQRRFAVVLHPRTAAESDWFVGGEAQQLFDRLGQTEMRPLSLRSYGESSTVKFCAALIKNTSETWMMFSGLDGHQVQQKLDENGAWLVDIDPYVYGVQPRYTVVLHKL